MSISASTDFDGSKYYARDIQRIHTKSLFLFQPVHNRFWVLNIYGQEQGEESKG